MDRLGVGSACSPAQDADDDDDDPRRPRRNSPQETPHSEVRRGRSEAWTITTGGAMRMKTATVRTAIGPRGRQERIRVLAGVLRLRTWTLVQRVRGRGREVQRASGGVEVASRQSDSRGGRDAEIFAEEPIRGEKRAKEGNLAVIEDEERHVLDDPAMKHRLTGNNAGSWSGAGAGDEAAAKGSPDGQVCGVNVVILPSAWYVLYWDMFMMMLLFAIIFLLPYEAAFVKSYTDLSTSEMSNTQFTFLVVNRILDAFFIMDFFLQFVLGYVDEQSGKVVTSLTQIRNRYLRSYFVIDVVSLFPFDQVVQSSSTPLLRAIKFLRMLKLLRALKELHNLATSQPRRCKSHHDQDLEGYRRSVNPDSLPGVCVGVPSKLRSR